MMASPTGTRSPLLQTPGRSVGETRGVSAPRNPIMGIYEESYEGSGDWTVRSGGKPLKDWSGLDPNAYKNNPKNPRQLRQVSPSLEQKSYNKRIQGLDIKYKEGDNLNDFRFNIDDHMVKHGLDTVAWVPELSENAEGSEVRNVVTDPAKFTVNYAKAIEVAKATAMKYDDFDKNNSEASIEFLENSIDISLKRRLNLVRQRNDSFTVVWLRLMHLLANYSSDHYDATREKVRKCTPTNYDREDFTLMTKEISPLIDELESGNQYDPNITLSMTQNISNKCTQGGIFAHLLYQKIAEIKQRVAECNFMSRQEANDYMKRYKLDPKSVLTYLEDEYRAQLKDNLWTPAHLPIDRTKPSLNTTCLPTGSDTNTLTHQVLALLQNSLQSNSKTTKKTRQNSPCNICGKMGHWAPECPEKNIYDSKQKTGEKKKGNQA